MAQCDKWHGLAHGPKHDLSRRRYEGSEEVDHGYMRLTASAGGRLRPRPGAGREGVDGGRGWRYWAVVVCQGARRSRVPIAPPVVARIYE